MEWNSGLYDPIRLDEILQIGAVKVGGPGSPILDTFNIYIQPQIHPRYSPAAAELPDLYLSESAELDFPAAFEAFMEWCGDDDLFATWGGNDLMVLHRNRTYWKLHEPLPMKYVDLQKSFSHTVGAANTPSLENALDYCRVPDIFDPHNALYDAVYTWMVCQNLPQEAIDFGVRELGDIRPPQKLPKRSTPWKGGFQSLSGLLNSRGVRTGVCPRCGEANRVNRWYPVEKGIYYAPFTCACGRPYYLRLEVRKQKDKLWGNTAPLRAAGSQKALFEEKTKGRDPVICAALPRNRRRRRRRPAPKSGQ